MILDVLLALLKVLGSLGVFLFGMKVASEGIQKAAGTGMRRIMATMTQSRWAGLLTGFLITCMIQSSSATTVMVVSFVNAGLLTLMESIGVIMGANLGTTLTAWLIALTGFKFSMSNLALPIIGIGLPLLFIGRNKLKASGETAIGFGLVFFGLGLLKDSVPDVKGLLASTDPEVVEQTTAMLETVTALSNYGFASVILFLVFGIVLTLLVQSSSAAMAITVTLSVQGWIDLPMGASIVLGENIGTTVTAYLASIGGNVNAKRAARAHFAFNIIGVAWMLSVFLWLWLPMIERLGDVLFSRFGEGVHDTMIAFNLALHHSLFNLANIMLLIWFVPQIARLVERWVKDRPGRETQSHLNYTGFSLVETGELNLPEAQEAVRGMAALTRDMFAGFREVFDDPDTDRSDKVAELKEMEDRSDLLTEEITQYLVRTSAAEISDRNARYIGGMMRIVSELEEVADQIYRLVKLTQRKYNGDVEFHPDSLKALPVFCNEVEATIAHYDDKLFEETGLEDVRTADRFERTLDDMRRKLNNEAIARMQDGADVRAEILNMDIHNHLEKIGNHALHILEENHRMNPQDARR